jgi:hypothetical protein
MSIKKYERQCERKFRHEHYLSALHHAMQLTEHDLVIYPCGICEGLHVGHLNVRYAAHCDRELNQKMSVIQRKIASLPTNTQAARKRQSRLKTSIQKLLIEYR